MSFSAKAINNDTSFSIESHWNLDKYENNIGFYNFQIWSNSLDDLLKLGEEALRLLEVQKPILSYNNSTPPSVFVRSGKYHKGKLDLQIVNTNRSNHVDFDGGLRVSETENVEYVTSTIDLNGDYISNIEVDSGSLFDIGFRIGDGIHTPDDLFMSDGPWGYDDAAPTTTVTNYTVAANEIQFDENEFPVERNINLKATTSQYIAAYRALTPKFNPIDLTSYNSFKLKAKGTGELVVRLVKESIGVWEEQYKTSIVLTEILKDYSLKFSEFRSISGVPINPNDVTSIVFTMLAENGEETIKEMTLEQLRFSIDNSYSKTALIEENGSDIEAVPNPMNYETNIYFKADNAEKLHLVIYNHIGQLVKRIEFTSIQGENILKLERENFNSGVYYCEIKSNNSVYKTLKLLME